MQVTEQLVLLSELSTVDQKGKATAEKLESVPGDAKKADLTAQGVGKQVDDARKRKETAEKERRGLDGELVAEKSKLKKWELRADTIRGEREHAALASEIGSQKRQIGKIEERMLELMQIIEDVDGELKVFEGKHKAAEDVAKAEWRKVADEIKALEEVKKGLAVQRKALLEKLPPVLVKRYEQVAAKRQGVGVAIIRGEVCACCKVTLPPQLCLQVRKGIVLEQCPSCSRILVHEAMTQSTAHVEG